jgi:DNA-binding response OmpR family regulator
MRRANTQQARGGPIAGAGRAERERDAGVAGARVIAGRVPAPAPLAGTAGPAILRVNVSRDAEPFSAVPGSVDEEMGIHIGELTPQRLAQSRADVVLLDARAVRPASVYRSIVRIKSAGWTRGILVLIEPGDIAVVPVSLSIGATDFVLSTAAPDELDARMRREAVRSRTMGARTRPSDGATGIQLHWRTHEVSLGETRIALTLREMQLLAVLLERAGEVVAAADLAGLAWGKSKGRGSGLATTYVCSLRKKLAWFGARFGIRTVRGVGYRFVV